MRAVKNYEPLLGTSVTSTKFQGVSTLSELHHKFGLERPSKLERRTQAELKNDPEMVQKSKRLRDAVQRRFNKQRMERAGRYADYIEQVENGARVPGGTPAITIYADCGSVPFDSDDEGLKISRGTPMIVIDGETQTEARFLLAEDDRLPESIDWPVAVTVYHGVSEEFARQILHDYNRYAHPVTERQTSKFNSKGPITRAARLALAKSGIKLEQINDRGTAATKKHLMAWDQVFQLAAGAYQPEQTLRGRVNAEHLSAINAELHRGMEEDLVDSLSSIIADVGNGKSIAGKLPALIWQVAGAVVGRDFEKTKLNWSAASLVYDQKVKRGTATKLSKIEKIETLRQALMS